jgi:hypothetical protein
MGGSDPQHVNVCYFLSLPWDLVRLILRRYLSSWDRFVSAWRVCRSWYKELAIPVPAYDGEGIFSLRHHDRLWAKEVNGIRCHKAKNGQLRLRVYGRGLRLEKLYCTEAYNALCGRALGALTGLETRLRELKRDYSRIYNECANHRARIKDLDNECGDLFEQNRVLRNTAKLYQNTTALSSANFHVDDLRTYMRTNF